MRESVRLAILVEERLLRFNYFCKNEHHQLGRHTFRAYNIYDIVWYSRCAWLGIAHSIYIHSIRSSNSITTGSEPMLVVLLSDLHTPQRRVGLDQIDEYDRMELTIVLVSYS